MCGFTGFWSRSEEIVRGTDAVIARMSSALTYRGPDDYGAWSNGDAGLGFGFRRLAVVEHPQVAERGKADVRGLLSQ